MKNPFSLTPVGILKHACMLEGLSEEDFIRKVNRKGHLDVVQLSSIKSCEDIDETNLHRTNLSI